MALHDLRQPREGQGKRSLWCALYNTCLMDACKKGWDNFDCEICVFQKDEPWPCLENYVERLHEQQKAI